MADNGGFSNVQLPEGFSEQELRASSWWVAHRETLRIAGFAAFIVFDVALMGFGLWGVADWLTFSGLTEARNVDLLASPAYAQSPQYPEAQEIVIGTPDVFVLPNGRNDFVVSVSNPNPDAWIELTYQFASGNELTTLRSGFLLPGQQKNLAELGVKFDATATDVQFKVVKRVFHRLDRHAVPDYDSWSKTRLDIPAVSPSITVPAQGVAVPTTVTSFTIINQTAYGYYQVPLNAFVYRGDTLIGANRITLDRLDSGASEPIQLYWYQSLPGATRIEVLPDINIFDPKAYQSLTTQ